MVMTASPPRALLRQQPGIAEKVSNIVVTASKSQRVRRSLMGRANRPPRQTLSQAVTVEMAYVHPRRTAKPLIGRGTRVRQASSSRLSSLAQRLVHPTS